MKFNKRNVNISPDAKIGNNVKIGDNTTIYANVEIGDNTIICNDCVIGEPLNAYYHDDDYEQPKTIIGASSLIRSHNIFYAGSKIGTNFNTGHRVTIREFMEIGTNCMVGTLSDLMGYSKIGNYTRLYNNVHVCQYAEIGNFVFIYPYTIFTNDSRPPSAQHKGATIGDYTQIAVHSILLPRVKVGAHCLIGANTTVTKDFDKEGIIIVGSPAKEIGKTTDIKSIVKEGSHYPWPHSYERGMPWEGIGYQEWLEQEKND